MDVVRPLGAEVMVMGADGGHAIVVDARPSAMTAFEPQDRGDALELAKMLCASGMLPRGLTRPEAVVYVVMAGRELGLTAVQSIRGLYVMDGKIVLSADMMVALVKRSGACRYFKLIETTDQAATYETLREGDPSPTRLTWTRAMAQRAGLTGGTWQKHPEAMLRARCAAALARAVYPDVCAGMYEPGEADEIAGRADATAAAHDDPAEPPVPAALANLRAGLGALGADPSPWQAAAVYAACRADLERELAGDVDAIFAAQQEAMGVCAGAPSSSAWSWHVRVATEALRCAPLGALLSDAMMCDGAADVVACWRLHRDDVKALPAATAKLAWEVCVRRYGEACPDDRTPQKTLKRLVDEADRPTPPTGTDAPRAAANDTAVGSGSEATAAEGPQASAAAQWAARAGVMAPVKRLAASFAAHEGEFGGEWERAHDAYLARAGALEVGPLSADRVLADARKTRDAKLAGLRAERVRRAA